MNDFRISYAYSATLLSESERTRPAFRNRTLAFAPSYDNPVFLDSISVNRQPEKGALADLVYAREEADFVSDITSGISYLGKSATKDIYEKEAGNYDILHMAMHTVIKSLDPVNSGMIFAESGSANSYLRPFEIYNVPLNSKMVVLSSCNTGTGTLFAGEGVLSLARGFIFSGSRSVVMSLWEVDDREGTEIMKGFYRNLKSGKQKSESLRNARLDYLKNADMLRAHPYYWSTLVNYGDDAPLYVSKFTKGILVIFLVLMGIYIFSYLRNR
jgi:CHAT domain-containing protein